MRVHCTALLVAAALLGAGAALAQTVPRPATGEAPFNIVFGGRQIGSEQVNVSRNSSGWIITSTGRQGPPFDFTITRFELQYTPDWQPLQLKVQGMLRNSPVALATSFSMTTAINEVTQNSATSSKQDQISAATIVLPNNVYAGYEALAARLSVSDVDSELPIYVPPQREIRARIRAITPVRLTAPGGQLDTRRYDVTFLNPAGPVEASITVDNSGRLVRLEIPSVGLLVAREDAASVAVRPQTARNPTDADVTMPANGFHLAGTITTPPAVAGRLRYPAILLIAGSGTTDRDNTVGGVAIFAQLARALADAGYIVLRYDRRGIGQSGGRTEAATLADYAEDAVAAVRFLSRRDDVDTRRLIVCGHGEGGAVALLAAARDKAIDGIVTIAAPGTSGADFILEQQRMVLADMKISDAEKQAKIDLQKRIDAAVVSGSGWAGIPEDLRKQADTPWFRSLLLFDPAAVLRKIRQPLLIVHGDLDKEVPPAQADRLGQLARARKKNPGAEVVHVPEMTHLLVTSADERTITARVTSAIAEWIRKTL